jgi:pyridoxamine 5'-phosphate oxidase
MAWENTRLTVPGPRAGGGRNAPAVSTGAPEVRAAPFAEPFARFGELLARARAEPEIREPTAMSVATVGEDGRPSLRMVLLKEFDERGFVFYTNLGSRKARELRGNPHAALCFHWQPFEIQVRIEGRVDPVSDAEADAYYASRPRGSRVGAWASIQSTPLPSYDVLVRRVEELDARFGPPATSRAQPSGAASAGALRHRVLAGKAQPPPRARRLHPAPRRPAALERGTALPVTRRCG